MVDYRYRAQRLTYAEMFLILFLRKKHCDTQLRDRRQIFTFNTKPIA